MIKRKHMWDNALTVIMTLLCLLWVYPIALIFINSLKKEGTFTTSTVFALPTKETFVGLENYTYGIFKMNFLSSLGYSLLITLTNSFKLFDQNVALTGGEPANMSEMLALNIYNTFYGRSGAQWKGIGQAKAVVFFLIVVVISLVQLHFTRSKEVQQ